MAWLPPELEIGEEPELKPLEPELEDEPEFAELEPEELEPLEAELEPGELEPGELEPDEVEPDEPEPELADDEEPVEVEPEPVEEVLVFCVDPGRTRASAPAVTTLAMVTAVVADRTLSRPRSLAAMARRTRSRCAVLMRPILRSGTRKSLHGPSRKPLNRASSLSHRAERGYPGNMKDS